MDENDVARNQALLRILSALNERERNFDGNDQLIQSLKRGPLNDKRIEEGLQKIPRGEFIPEEEQDHAFVDSPLPLHRWGFNVSAPHIYVICLQALLPLPGMSFLDIGCGCGHLTALASFLTSPNGSVLGLDIRDDIIKFASENVRKFSLKSSLPLPCVFETRNCFLPDFEERKFDRIHCGASCPVRFLPNLVSLLNPGGILVTPCGMELLKITKHLEDDDFDQEVICNVRYGELILPSKADIHATKFANERKRTRIIKVPKSTFERDMQGLESLRDQMRESVEKHFQKTESSNLIFRVRESEFHVHREVVGKRCDHFGAMFSSGMKDSQNSVISVFPSCENNSFEAFLEFLYTDEVKISEETGEEILELASFYQVPQLKVECEKFFREGLDQDNCCEILALADRHSCPQLKANCQSYIIDHFPLISSSPPFLALNRDLLVEITSLACSQLALATSHLPSDS